MKMFNFYNLRKICILHGHGFIMYLSKETANIIMPYTCLIVFDPEIPFTLPEMKGNSGTDGANYRVIK